jgi:hypothetical protein
VDRRIEAPQEAEAEAETDYLPEPEAFASMYDDMGDTPVPAAPAPKRPAQKSASRSKSGGRRRPK